MIKSWTNKRFAVTQEINAQGGVKKVGAPCGKIRHKKVTWLFVMEQAVPSACVCALRPEWMQLHTELNTAERSSHSRRLFVFTSTCKWAARVQKRASRKRELLQMKGNKWRPEVQPGVIIAQSRLMASLSVSDPSILHQKVSKSTAAEKLQPFAAC